MNIAIIGGGPAGMAAAVAAKEIFCKYGVSGEVILLERQDCLGGVLPQCIHPGFGTQIYQQDYTGGEYAEIWRKKLEEKEIKVMTETTVLELTKERTWSLHCASAKVGSLHLPVDGVIMATGCRERTLGSMRIPGSRPAGIFTAGAAQLMMNRKNYLPGRSAVILGSGDIGLIMARRMTLEGIKVKMILGQKSTGLLRNVIQCVDDFQLPMRYGWTVVSTHGYGRLKGVSIAPVNEEGVVDYAHKEYIPCDTLLVATGLIPERELTGNLDEETEGLFFCGNVSRVHDLADGVTLEGMEIGAKAATFVLQREEEEQQNIDYVFSKLLSAEYLAEKEGKSADADPVVYGGEGRGNMVCTICPKGCALWVEREPFSVKGHQCQRGEAFAKEEVASPKRTVTTVVKTKDGRLLSVRTDRQIKKAEIWAVMKAVKQITVETPMEVGDTIRENIAGTGAKLIATAKLD